MGWTSVSGVPRAHARVAREQGSRRHGGRAARRRRPPVQHTTGPRPSAVVPDRLSPTAGIEPAVGGRVAAGSPPGPQRLSASLWSAWERYEDAMRTGSRPDSVLVTARAGSYTRGHLP